MKTARPTFHLRMDNPDDQSCSQPNSAKWFYGRLEKNKFWKYLPYHLTGKSLHPDEGGTGYPKVWRDFCIDNRIVIIDLIKSIDVTGILTDFSDYSLESVINSNVKGTHIFNPHCSYSPCTSC